MGTNIYLYVEHKKDHHWECVPFIDDISDYDSYYHSFYRNDMVGIIPKPKIQLAWNVGRDYKLFGLLAGVRGDIEPISFPKGLPLDISNLVSKEYRAVGNYGGSASYFSLKELLEVKDLLIDDSRFLPMFAYKKYKEDRLDYKISDWYFAATPGCKFVSNSEMERLINLSLFLDDPNYMTEIKFKNSVSEICYQFYHDIIPRMQMIDSDPDKTRIIFWFD